MLYRFKQHPEDFIVEELLPSLPTGQGDVFYVYFEKRNLTTMDILTHLQRQLFLSREEMGIAGLKDKAGITRQWITIFHSGLERAGGRDRFLASLREVAEVLETTWGEKPLKVGGNAGNKFFIRLSATESVADEQKKLITENIHTLQTKGFPNCFGAQRFGKGNKNFWEAKQVMKGTTGKNPPEVAYRLRFMLQAYASMYFNEYVMRRWEKGLHWLSGDIVVDRYYAEGAKVGVYQHQEVRLFDYGRLKKEKAGEAFFEPITSSLGSPLTGSLVDTARWIPTGPMLGRNLLLPPAGTKARIRDDQLIQLAEFDEQALAICRGYQLRGVRRPLWVVLTDLEWAFEGEDVLLHFSLPTGSYATVLLAFILAGVDKLTLKDNRLEIPRIVKKPE